MIALHFATAILIPLPGFWGSMATAVSVSSLCWASALFMSAAVPYRSRKSSQWMLWVLIGTYTLYIVLLLQNSVPAWSLDLAAFMIGAGPLCVALAALRRFSHALRWITVALHGLLAVFLLLFQHRPGNGGDLALNAVLFTTYFGCALHFGYAYRRVTTGTFITLAGFVLWAAVFSLAPWLTSYFPDVHLENEVWNLPKYVVAVGMILLLLEEQIEHNKHLALHDELTNLPNRRLFQDRLSSAIERARRTNTQTALLLVDLNRFKLVNDTLGHHVGDMLLRRAAEIFAARVRRSDTVARTGGDEFSIILEEPTSREDAQQVARSLIELIGEPMQLDGNTVRTGASIGLAIFPEDALDAETLCIAADLRMYEVKRHSRGQADTAATVPSNHQNKMGRQLQQTS